MGCWEVCWACREGPVAIARGRGSEGYSERQFDAALDAFRADEFVSKFRGALDDVATPDQLAHVATLIPNEWLAPMATGSPAQCAEAVKGQLDMGCDGVIMHGVNPSQLRSVIEAY